MSNLVFVALGFFMAEFINVLLFFLFSVIGRPKSKPSKDEWKQL